MKNYIVKPLLSKPGIQRDGTPFASEYYIDSQWVRFYMGKPRKIGGYKLIDAGNNKIVSSLFAVPKENSVDLYIGRSSSLNFINLDFNGNGSGEVNRTPTNYVENIDNVWDFDLFTNASNTNTSNSFIVASSIPNGNDVNNTTNGNLYYGDINRATRLTQIFNSDKNPIQVSGGIVFAPPVMIAFGNNGLIRWSALGDITSWPNEYNLVIANTKIIQAYRTRGSTAPQILCWTLNSLINVTYSPTVVDDTDIPGFASSTIQDNITVISPNSIVEYNQQFFWIGIDQFYFFNGIVQRLDNSMSTDWFFQYLNYKRRAKIWGMTIPRYKEIWWFYPRKKDPANPKDDPQECNAVIIYNTELNVWYDSVISRASGVSPGIFPLPIMSDSDINIPSSKNYGIWMHEFGVDKQIGTTILAIDSFFETEMFTLFENNPENNRLIRSRRIEPDFAQIGEMTVTVNNRMFPSDTLLNGKLLQSGPYSFNGDTQKIDYVNSQGRLVSFVFDSNVVGGAYQAGKTLLDYEVGDVRP